jgi:UDP-GlcNAc:undecaprenyl-phosphate GlcNAc-1-phosphate transferase
MTNIGFSQRRTLAYLYGWALILAALALALRFVPYSDNHGHFNTGWTIVIVLFALAAVAASVYLVVVLEILKLRSERARELFRVARALPPEAVDEGVARELETGTFAVVDPSSGELEVLDPETGEFEALHEP